MVALQSLFGGAVLIALCWALSEDRRRVPWRMVLSGLALGVILAVALLKVPPLAAAHAPRVDPESAVGQLSNHRT